MMDLFRVILLMGALVLLKPALLLAGPFYIVIGTFSAEERARQFSHSLKPVFEDAAFTFDPGLKVYYVHVMETSHQGDAENFRNRLQDHFGFRDAWIYANLNSGQPSTGTGAGDDYIKVELYTGGSVLLGSADNSYVSLSKHQGENKEKDSKPTGNAFLFTAETRLGTAIPAKVSLLDRKGIYLSAFKTGEAVAVGGKQQAQTFTLVCEAPGFNTVSKIIDLGNLSPTPDIKQNSDGVWEVRFTLPKLKADEVVLLYHHMFYPDAAIFESAAKKQMEALVGLLRGNPATRIVINSHCNLSEKRTIRVPASGRSPFDLDESVEKSASDKQLTKERAEVLRDYLAEQGIEPNRVSMFGWGSVHLLVKSSSENRALNDRMEVQLTGL
jgi:outer membrane protein OmpA-like peptidoglycan-associated protein